MKHLTIGLIAQVDSGKTSLAEAWLYQTGAVRQLGRVDQKTSLLDPDNLEKARGVTIFSHQAELATADAHYQLIDTPGHLDFASQMEASLSVLDYAVLLISASDPLAGYPTALWDLLAKYQVPVFIFVNKMDLPTPSRAQILENLQTTWSEGCTNFSDEIDIENAAMQDDAVLEKYLTDGQLADEDLQNLILERKVFPVYFGSALKLLGTADLLAGLAKWTIEPKLAADFGARVFKISHDQHERLTWVKLTGGELRPKTVLPTGEKINQIRLYQGGKFQTASELKQGVAALTGLTASYVGQGLGKEKNLPTPVLQPSLSYAVLVAPSKLHEALTAFNELADEDPLLQVAFSETLQEIRVSVMGELQVEVLKAKLQDRFNLHVEFSEGQILYHETITKPIEGVGHFEPLRHYAEVHLLLEPLPAGSGIEYANKCSLEVLDKNMQHQIMTSLAAKKHKGVVLGMPLTDVRISLVGGKSSQVHTVGGDMRQAAWRAVRQGLMMAQAAGHAQVLEPWYKFVLTLPQEQVGHALSDIDRMGGDSQLTQKGNLAMITGHAPVSQMREYGIKVRSYTSGQGVLQLLPGGNRPCEVANNGYDAEGDLDNTPDSVFCKHGAGYPVKWNQVPQTMHCPYYTKWH
ncbi:GTP-binding protein [Lactobacillus corticis]|uniref:Elongation factor G n=1 Tax=Lactobacillus corticis TaxID=2201249 RepID=A0A916VHL1_9LACO|nr:GTP-binding protein [Lactobacillus corticis]GFZ26747.1 elongation factor G [Lactobacillus corticis]